MSLGLSRAEFLRMSPREFHALAKRYQEREERADRRFATLQAFYANCHGSKLTTEDFMGGSNKKKEKQYPTDEQLAQQLTAVFGVGPGAKKATGA